MFLFGGKNKFGRNFSRRKCVRDMEKDVIKKKNNKKTDSDEEERNPDLSSLEADLDRRLRTYINDDIQKCFDSFDVSGTGSIHFQQIKSALESFDIEADDEDCEAIISAFDTTGGGMITYEDFHREMHDVMAEGTSEQHIRMVFDMMDEDSDGIIGVDEIKKQFEKFGITITDDEAMEYMSKIDIDKNGFIDYEMFQEYCNGKDLVQEIGKESAEQIKLLKEESCTQQQNRGQDDLNLSEGLNHSSTQKKILSQIDKSNDQSMQTRKLFQSLTT